MQEYHILKLISAQNKEASFHTPGHKKDSDYFKDFPVSAMDTTELSYTDDLSSPDGVIADAQRDIAGLTGAKQSYIVTDGSTAGVMAMIYAVRRRGGKIIVARNCHKSVWNACTISGTEPVIVQGEVKDGIMMPPAPEQIDRIVCANEDVIGLVITSPDYYGNIAPLDEYSKILKAKGKYLLVDGAHGGHLAYGADRIMYAGNYADIWIDGVHKSMPALTQGSLVNISELTLQNSLEEGLNIFRTSSPSYPLMASVEYAVKYCSENVERAEKVKSTLAEVKQKVKKCGYGVFPSADWTKFVVDCYPLGINTSLACEYLEKNGIYAEFNDGRYILFYLSVMTESNDLHILCDKLADMAKIKELRAELPPQIDYSFADRSVGYLRALSAESEYVELNCASGRICAANAGVSPPCIPIIAAGEVITASAVEVLSVSGHTFGIKNGRIKVVKDRL